MTQFTPTHLPAAVLLILPSYYVYICIHVNMLSIYHTFSMRLNMAGSSYLGLLIFSARIFFFLSIKALNSVFRQKSPFVFPRPNALGISPPVHKASLPRCETFDTSSHSEFHKRITAAQYAAPALLFFPI